MIPMIIIYNAGPLFNEADRKQRSLEESLMITTLMNNGYSENNYEIYNPATTEINFEVGNPTPADIFKNDYDAIKETTHFFFDLSTMDEGTHVELGFALARLMNGEDVKIYPVISDSRVNAKDKSEFTVPKGWNQFVIGSLLNNGITIYKSFEEALKAFENDIQ